VVADSLGYRKKFGVVAPSTNTAVQPEYDDMRPRGVTNHFGRIHIPNDPIRDDDDFSQLLANIRRAMFAAIDQVMTCEPDYLILGMSSETFWDGSKAACGCASGSRSMLALRWQWARTRVRPR
jgi:maleate isomerase